MRSEFLYFLTSPGSERALKAEVSREKLGWVPAYARPGFVTMKVSAGPIEALLPYEPVFARAFGLSFGKYSPDTVETELVRVATEANGEPILRVLPRTEELAPQAAELEKKLQTRLPKISRPRSAEAVVIDVVVVGPTELWLGARVFQGALRPAAPGMLAPEPAPSRAYLKLHELVSWSGFVLRPGQRAVEVGVSPGGAAYYLLEQGLEVLGIDPAEVEEPVRSHPRFRHLKKSFSLLEPKELPTDFDWLLIDVNAAPPVALKAVDMLSKRARGLRGLLLTLKLKDARAEDAVPHALADLRALGFKDVRAAQLSSHRREIGVIARYST
ncbi:MAG: SAM-dependent methyltransferase [Myxococcota bacterium]